MRGRTNITQRTGPSVIGELVTQKQVTGSKIEVGDFVEFTGETSQQELLQSGINFCYSSNCKISNDLYCLVFWSPSYRFRFVFYDSEGIVTYNDLSGIESYAKAGIYMYNGYDCSMVFIAKYYDNKLYVSFANLYKEYGSFTESDFNSRIFIFDVDSNYNVTYNSKKDLTSIYNYAIENSLNSERGYFISAPILRNGKFYVLLACYYYGSSSSAHSYKNGIYFVLDNDLQILNSFETMQELYINSTSDGRVSFLVCESEKYIFVTDGMVLKTGGYNSNRINILKLSDDTFSLKTSKPRYFCSYSRIAEIDNIYFVTGLSTGSAFGVYISAFYMVNDDIVLIDSLRFVGSIKTSSDTGYYPIFEPIVKRKAEDTYDIIVVGNLNTTSVSSRVNFGVFLLHFEDGSITLLDSSTLLLNDNSKDYEVQNVFEVENGVYETVMTRCEGVFSDMQNEILKIRFSVKENSIIWSDALDLVKKYSSRIDGVAKTEGSAGQQISVYIPAS